MDAWVESSCPRSLDAISSGASCVEGQGIYKEEGYSGYYDMSSICREGYGCMCDSISVLAYVKSIALLGPETFRPSYSILYSNLPINIIVVRLFAPLI